MPNEIITKSFSKASGIRDDLIASGHIFNDDSEFICALLTGLPKQYDTYVRV